jgi:hypothetical protein
MARRGHDDEFDEGVNEEADRSDFDGEDGELQTDAEVTCPYCGEICEITLDAAGGKSQTYVEDCPVCCRPWQVHVVYDSEGAAEVTVEETGD